MTQKIFLRFSVLSSLVVIAAFSRILPHPYNFSPLAAMGLLGAAFFSKKWQAIFLPLAATWLSDLFINNVLFADYFQGFTWFYQGFYWQYGAYALIAIIGYFLFNTISIPKILAGSIFATTIFFLITNFGAWLGNPLYPQTFQGLMASYIAGIPFLQGSFLGDVFYSAVLFGGFYIAGNTMQFPVIAIRQE